MTVYIKQTKNGGWYSVNVTRGENTLHYVRKTRKGAVGHAKRLWGAAITIRDIK